MRKGFTRILIFVFGIAPFGTVAQTANVDSLKGVFVDATDTLKVKIALELSKAYQSHDLEESIRYGMLAKYESIEIGFDHGEALSYKYLASAYYAKGEMPRAEELVRTSIPKLKESGTKLEIADATNLLGLICMEQAKYYQAEQYYQEALNTYIDLSDTAGVIIATHNIGVVNYYKGSYDVTARYYNRSLRLAEELNNKKYISTNQLNLGLLYSHQKHYSKAKSYVKKALLNYRIINNDWGIASCLKSLGTIYFNQEDYDSSYLAHSKALELYTEMGREQGIGQQQCYLADIHVQWKEYQKAMELYKASIWLRKKNDDKYGLTLSYTGLANAYAGNGNLTIAKMYYDSALVLSKNIGSPWRTAEIYLEVSSFQASIKNFQMAYESLLNYVSVEDTLFRSDKTELVHELEAQYTFEKKEKDIQVHRREISLLKKANKRFVYLIIALFIIAILTLLLIMIRNKQVRLEIEKNRIQVETDLEKAKMEQEKIQAELNYKKKELTQLALHISQQNEFLESLRKSLKEAEAVNRVNMLERELESQLNIDKQRESFDMNIDLIHEDFYKKLNERFPVLTENEKKLCAMLRLNLSSKEIASIQNISPKSVDMNRYRLRKKLELSSEEDIVKFLASI